MRVEPGWKAPGGAGSGGTGSRRLRPRRRLGSPAPGAGAGGAVPGASEAAESARPPRLRGPPQETTNLVPESLIWRETKPLLPADEGVPLCYPHVKMGEDG
ncbi:myosin heavy chain IB-like [Myiozetetes cayanensis]|uniref:myosin heavy chain IB-like n=1 Tax=Myiozetetes cayanensis TaxID=478635 RepID=UPI00215E7B40|nr:myosin heavy chain IB-like [Myiozetetes cayanensis]